MPAAGPGGMKAMKLSEMVRTAIEKKGYKNLKNASRALGISPELLRVVMNRGHVPKDKTLALIARKLGLDMSLLVLTAHREKVPDEAKGFFLMPSPAAPGRKRKYPLSEEQTAYLAKVLSVNEIMMLRKIRQMNDTGRAQLSGFVDYLYASRRAA